ncbi:MAG TPA: tetratricopeptide repeat protein [Polyangia bacterium]|jgi:tetratricopeptide (TPR) repeat protein|nr:tetratricopeptide repeat protein [Polyangia bacterium]
MTFVRAAAIFALLGPVATSGAFAAAAVAKGAPAAPADDASSKEARELFKRAELNFNLLKFAEALSDYQAAYQAKPLPGFLFNIAQCHRNMGQYERARFFFRRYLVLDPRTANRPKVEDLIAEMTRLLEKQETAAAATASSMPPSTTATEPEARPAPAITATAVRPANAENAPLLLTQQPLPPTQPSRRPVYKRWWFWGGVAAAVVGGSVAVLLLTRDDKIPRGSLEPINGRP